MSIHQISIGQSVSNWAVWPQWTQKEPQIGSLLVPISIKIQIFWNSSAMVGDTKNTKSNQKCWVQVRVRPHPKRPEWAYIPPYKYQS